LVVWLHDNNALASIEATELRGFICNPVLQSRHRLFIPEDEARVGRFKQHATKVGELDDLFDRHLAEPVAIKGAVTID
jgi:hypothetical protein